MPVRNLLLLKMEKLYYIIGDKTYHQFRVQALVPIPSDLIKNKITKTEMDEPLWKRIIKDNVHG